MSDKPIFVVAHPRACSTAFERIFMTQHDTIHCFHEPFSDAFYCGPERLSSIRYPDEKSRIESGFSQTTYASVLEEIKKASEGKRVFIKELDYYICVPDGKATAIAPSLEGTARSTTNGAANGITNGTVNGHAATNSSLNGVANGATNGATYGTANGATNGTANRDTNGITNGATNGTTNGHTNGVVKSCVHCCPSNGHTETNGDSHQNAYQTSAEPGNPTVIPLAIQKMFHFAFLIRDPHYSIPSAYRCTIPPLREMTDICFDPLKAGYSELRQHFDYLRKEGLVGPRVATRPDLGVDGEIAKEGAGHEICVIDADELLDAPEAMIEEFCKSVGLKYDPGMLRWDREIDHAVASDKFEKWRGYHEDALQSAGLKARPQKRATKTREEFDADWRAKYGEEAAALIRQTVDQNMPHYLYLKEFAMRV
ncbi:hypothetical protein N7532_006973 [Penicillium argentinense]|uniref:P-loop containing nucleoside triphosphate hydrolase protein n=1 Tax=Penicillium argentinense TaxID=1131581 RepID=A0A9W9FGW9_9EURO|nr:uncharacterized protein N7532_006973 [Penicillium argentinense]KAJ5099972.1 hypothetical protein N7532_006973 [Penicillium argentinense]